MRWRYRQATDPREEVYGLVGLIPPDSLSGIPALRDISYSVTPVALFARVTLDLTIRQRSQIICGRAGTTAYYSQFTNMGDGLRKFQHHRETTDKIVATFSPLPSLDSLQGTGPAT